MRVKVAITISLCWWLLGALLPRISIINRMVREIRDVFPTSEPWTQPVIWAQCKTVPGKRMCNRNVWRCVVLVGNENTWAFTYLLRPPDVQKSKKSFFYDRLRHTNFADVRQTVGLWECSQIDAQTDGTDSITLTGDAGGTWTVKRPFEYTFVLSGTKVPF